MPVSLFTWTPSDGIPAAANYPSFGTVNSIPFLSFASGGSQVVTFEGVIPQGVDLTSGLQIVLNWVSPGATTGNVNWAVAYERLGIIPISGDNFSAQVQQQTTVGGTINVSVPVTINIPYSSMQNSVPGDSFRIQLQRLTGTPEMAGAAQLLSVHMYVTPLTSPNGTTIPPAAQIIDSSMNVWTVVGGVVYENNAPAGFSSGVVTLAINGGVIWQNNGTNWYSWTGTTWVQGNYPFGQIVVGQNIILNTDDNTNANLLLAQQMTLTQNATLASLSFYVTAAAGNLVLGLYTDNGNNQPLTLIGQTASFVPVAGWNTQPVPGSHALTPGKYWLAYWPSSNALGFRSGAGTFYGNNSLTFGPTMPSSFAQNFSGSVQWSFYATLNPTLSPNNTTVPPAQSIVDSNNDYWTLSGGQVYKDSNAAGSTPNAVELAYVSPVVWYTDSSSNWFHWTGSAWVAGSNPIPTESANLTQVPPANQITDAGFNVWTISGGQVLQNGVLAGSTSSVQLLAYVNHTVWQENTSLNWWSWNGTTWVPGSNPISGGGGSGTKPGLVLYGGIMDFNGNTQGVPPQDSQTSYPCPDNLWKPIANGPATGNQFPSNWWRIGGVYLCPFAGSTPAQLKYSTLGPIWQNYCQTNHLNGLCMQLWYPAFMQQQPGQWFPDGQSGVDIFSGNLDGLAPYMPAGTYQILINEFLHNGDSSGFLNYKILAALGGAGNPGTGYDGLIALVRLTRQHLPGVLLGLNETNVCSFESAGSGSTNNYNAQQAIDVYRILAQNGAALDWLGCEGYGLAANPGGSNCISIINSTLNNVGSQLVTTKGTGAPGTIAYTEITPGSFNWNVFGNQLPFWQQFLPMVAANQYVFGIHGPWKGYRRSVRFNPPGGSGPDENDWFYDDTTIGGTDPNGQPTSNGHVTSTLTFIQGWTPSNVHP